MKSVLLAALVVIGVPTALQAQDSDHYTDLPGNDNEFDGNHGGEDGGDYSASCTTLSICDDPHGGEDGGSSDDTDGGGLLDSIKGAWDKAKDWYDQQKAASQAEREQRAAEERARLAALEARILDPAVREALLAYRAQEGGLWQQAHRILGDSQRGPFSGFASDDEGMITYNGTRANGYIWGDYTIQYFDTGNTGPVSDSGGFAGSVTRFGRVTGAYVNRDTNERGNFTGSVSSDLSTIFNGGFNCTQNCSDDD